MLEQAERHARIAIKRVQKKKNPFIFKSYSKKPKHVWLAKRHARERRFRFYGLMSIFISSLFLAGLGWSIFSNGLPAFTQTQIFLPVTFSADLLDPENTKDPEILRRGNYRQVLRDALHEIFPDVSERREKRSLYGMVSKSARYKLRNMVLDDPALVGQTIHLWLPASSDIDIFFKGQRKARAFDDSRYRINESQFSWIKVLTKKSLIRRSFNVSFFTNGDSRAPEQAGILGSAIGSFFTILVCILCAFPLGVATALYLEEFAPKNWFTDFIEININNLAAVPSIIFGLLGLSIYLNLFGLPRSSSFVGGLVLALLVLPVIVIATRNALRSVPKSIRFAAAAMGATPVQVAFHHTFLYALPGIMTGVILSIARALGETAPLLMIGMVAFVADIPKSMTDPATSLPVQVYLWSNNPEIGFVEKTSAAIIVLLFFLVLMNAAAIYIRRRFEIKW